MTRRDSLARLVQDGFGTFRCLETSQGKPKLNGERDDLDSAGEEDACVSGGGFEVDSFFPEADGVGDVFEGCKRR